MRHRKKILIIIFVLILFLCIQPSMAIITGNNSLQPTTGSVYNPDSVHQYTLSRESMAKAGFYNLKNLTTIDKSNLSDNQKKLSTALLMQTLPPTMVSVEAQNNFKSSLMIKEIPNTSLTGSGSP